jgi:hypothetical protein
LDETPNRNDERMGKQMLRKSVLVVLLVMGGMMVALPAVAQDTLWRIDSAHSTARLFLASSKNPGAADNVGVARTSGVIDQEGGDFTRSDFDFTIYPADKNADQSGNNPDYTVISFKSTHVAHVNQETFRVTGDLTLSYVEPSVAIDPGGVYTGPLYGPPVHYSVTREAVFEFHKVSPAGTQKATDNKAEWLGSSTTIGEEFPQLLHVVSTTNWPVFIADERCVVPSVGEDFASGICTKTSPTLVANEVQMQLDLYLAKTTPAMPAISGQ